MNEDKVPVMVQSKRDLQSISQNFCQNIPNFVPKLASPLDYFNSWASRGLVYKLAFEFQYELLDFVTNFGTKFGIFWQKFCEIDCKPSCCLKKHLNEAARNSLVQAVKLWV